MNTSSPHDAATPRVGLFVTCLVDLVRPSVGFAAVQLLQAAGATVEVPMAQTCCGQPAYNAGDRRDTRAIARQVIEAFAGFDYVVAPSGSCAGMLRRHYPDLFEIDDPWRARAEEQASRTWELLSFLAEVMHADIAGTWPARATYHDACSGLRELGVKAQPRALLAGMSGLELVEAAAAETCCGFGGTFCVKYPDISTKIVDAKLDDVTATGAGLLLGGDLGCLMNIAGRAKRRGLPLDVRHTVEVLAGMTDLPSIGSGRD